MNSQELNTPKGALFDMDGLLLDSERLLTTCFQEVADGMGFENFTPILMSLIGVRRKESEAILRANLRDEHALSTFLTRSNSLFSERTANGIALKSGVKQLLTKLEGRGVPCAVATSTQTDKARHHLEKAGLLVFFQTVTGGDQVDNAKPAPDIYLKAATSLSVSAVDCVAFEDSDPGTQAAFASGARVIQVPDLLQPSQETRALGHIIAPSLLDGAAKAGLI